VWRPAKQCGRRVRPAEPVEPRDNPTPGQRDPHSVDRERVQCAGGGGDRVRERASVGGGVCNRPQGIGIRSAAVECVVGGSMTDDHDPVDEVGDHQPGIVEAWGSPTARPPRWALTNNLQPGLGTERSAVHRCPRLSGAHERLTPIVLRQPCVLSCAWAQFTASLLALVTTRSLSGIVPTRRSGGSPAP